MINFKKELEKELKKYSKTLKDIKWVADTENGYRVPLDKFFKLAESFEYDNVFIKKGLPTINSNLMIGGRTWWLEREIKSVNDSLNIEYWRFNEYPLAKQPLLVKYDYEIFTDNVKRLSYVKSK